MMVILIIWAITIILALGLTRWALKSDGSYLDNQLGAILFFSFIPLFNIFVIGNAIYSISLDKDISARDVAHKIFFIKRSR